MIPGELYEEEYCGLISFSNGSLRPNEEETKELLAYHMVVGARVILSREGSFEEDETVLPDEVRPNEEESPPANEK